MGFRRKVAYFRCADCGFRHENTPASYYHIGPGGFCPECGKEVTEYEMLHRDNMADVPRESRHFYEPNEPDRSRPRIHITCGGEVGR